MTFVAELSTDEVSKVQTLDLGRLETLNAEIDNRRESWLKERRGRFTASEMHRLLTYENEPDKLPKGAETYVLEKVIEVLTDESKKGFSSTSTEWGNEYEEEAIELFSRKRDVNVKFIGENQKFVKYGKDAGGTPDGIGHGFFVEVKCPDSKTHFIYVIGVKDGNTLKEVEKKYYWQIQSSLLFTGKNYAYFISYDPRFKAKSKRLHVVKIERNEADIEFLKKRLEMASSLKNKMLFDFKNKELIAKKPTPIKFSNSLL